jgi:hypothetical protein
MNRFTTIIIFLFCSFITRAQKNHNREVVLQVGDTLVKSYILTGDVKETLSRDKEYYWYTKGMINSNFGGFAGSLFHGEYKAFLNNKLIEKGQFEKGLKSGTWISWYQTGKIKKICTWKSGKQKDKSQYFDENGVIIGTKNKGTKSILALFKKNQSNVKKVKQKDPEKATSLSNKENKSDKAKKDKNIKNVPETTSHK